MCLACALFLQVEWISPIDGGCVTLRALLQVYQRDGSKEYGMVRHTVCARDQFGSIAYGDGSGSKNVAAASCCACGEAKYEVSAMLAFCGNTNIWGRILCLRIRAFQWGALMSMDHPMYTRS